MALHVIDPRSSFIARLEFNSEQLHLTVQFKNGVRYRYYDVSKKRFATLRNAKSVGSYYTKRIKGEYKSRKLKPADYAAQD